MLVSQLPVWPGPGLGRGLCERRAGRG